jgi:hypothetical protein
VFNSSKDHPNAGAPRLQVHRSAFDGLGRAEKEKEGKETEGMKLSFVAAFVAEEGISLEMAVGGRPESWIIAPVNMTCSELLPLSDCFKDVCSTTTSQRQRLKYGWTKRSPFSVPSCPILKGPPF